MPQSARNFDVGTAPSTGPAIVSVRSAPTTAAIASEMRRRGRFARPPKAIPIVAAR